MFDLSVHTPGNTRPLCLTSLPVFYYGDNSVNCPSWLGDGLSDVFRIHTSSMRKIHTSSAAGNLLLSPLVNWCYVIYLLQSTFDFHCWKGFQQSLAKVAPLSSCIGSIPLGRCLQLHICVYEESSWNRLWAWQLYSIQGVETAFLSVIPVPL